MTILLEREAGAAPAAGGTQDIFYSRGSRMPRPMIVRAEGIRMWDEDGREYIDASCGPMVSSIGHGNPRVIEAMARQARTLDYAYTRVARNRANLDLADRLAALAGPGYERVHFASGGSEAIDNAIKLVRQHALATGRPQKQRLIALSPAYHGGTIASLALGAEGGLVPFLDGLAVVADKVPAPVGYRVPAGHGAESYAMDCAAALERKILALGPETVLAFFIEPVGGLSTGAVVPPPSYMREVRRICTRYDVLMVADEVLCGIGRTGELFAARHWPDAMPDIIVLAKALGGGHAPLGAVLAPAAMVDRMAERTGFDFSYSYNAHPIACAAGLAVLAEIEERALVANARARGAEIEHGLRALAGRFPVIGDVRGIGMLWAVELVRDRSSKAMFPDTVQINERAVRHGLDAGLMLYARPSAGSRLGHWVMLAPPLTVTREETAEILQRLERALATLGAELAAL